LEYEYLRTDLPPAQLPAGKDIRPVVPHAVDKEEVPSLETLREDSHFTETASGAAAGDKDSSGCLGLDENTRAHLDAAPELPRDVAKEPVFRYIEPRMLMESLDQQVTVPQGDGAVWECRGADATGELALKTTEFILKILRSDGGSVSVGIKG
jgi:hypothetical protein